MIASRLQEQKGEIPVENKKKITTKQIVLVGLLAAMTCVGSGLRIKVPEVVGTSAFHLGNILCALSGVLLGPWLGGLAAGLGSAVYDMLDPMYIQECWLTFLMKGAYGVLVGLVIRGGKGEWGYGKEVLATITGAVGYAILYLAKTFFYSGMLMYGLTTDAAWATVIAKIPATVFNAVVAIVATPLLAVTLRKALTKSKLSID